ncbi:apolipoprotein D-like [Aphidius gifuensis]|uniref:apolipoprotein D-like n=1 Tax=Aphidius gifuensis TaxID=684658 RepID=UPI001CDB5709|nr:apolipoprotein D-like [Aphidius gifuensis]
MKLIIFFFVIISGTVGQQELSSYPEFVPMENFNFHELLGKWYEIKRIPNRLELNQTCSALSITLNYVKTMTIDVPSLNSLTGFLNKWAAVGTPTRRGYPSEFNLKFPVLALQRERTLTILDTDYKNFQVAVMIETLDDSSFLEYIWILSRKTSLEQVYLDHAFNTLHMNNIDTDIFESVDQNNCPTISFE